MFSLQRMMEVGEEVTDFNRINISTSFIHLSFRNELVPCLYQHPIDNFEEILFFYIKHRYSSFLLTVKSYNIYCCVNSLSYLITLS